MVVVNLRFELSCSPDWNVCTWKTGKHKGSSHDFCQHGDNRTQEFFEESLRWSVLGFLLANI